MPTTVAPRSAAGARNRPDGLRLLWRPKSPAATVRQACCGCGHIGPLTSWSHVARGALRIARGRRGPVIERRPPSHPRRRRSSRKRSCQQPGPALSVPWASLTSKNVHWPSPPSSPLSPALALWQSGRLYARAPAETAGRPISARAVLVGCHRGALCQSAASRNPWREGEAERVREP